MLRVLPIFLAAGLTLRAAAPQYTIQTVAGSDLDNDWGAAVLAPFVQPEALAMDSAGNLYIADAGDHRVRKVDSGGRVTTIAGTGRPGFSGDGGPAKYAQLNQPYSVDLDPAGNIYIADLGNARVRCIDVDGNIRTIAGGGSTAVTSASTYTGVPALEGAARFAAQPAGELSGFRLFFGLRRAQGLQGLWRNGDAGCRNRPQRVFGRWRAGGFRRVVVPRGAGIRFERAALHRGLRQRDGAAGETGRH